VTTYENSPTAFSWTNSESGSSVTDTTTGVFVSGGFLATTVDLSASSTPTVVLVYVGAWGSGGAFNATLVTAAGASETWTSNELSAPKGIAMNLMYGLRVTPGVLHITWSQETAASDGNITLQSVIVLADS
jgi:hypothetical protein